MLSERISALAADRSSGAADILARAIAILREALAAEADILDVARALVRAQPSMAPLWNAALAALAARDDPRRFETFAQRVAHAPRALIRFSLDLFGNDARGADKGTSARQSRSPLHVVTLSNSGSVLAVLDALHKIRPLHVSCAEGRPALEGRTLATRLAASGIAVTFMSDAAIGLALASADAVLVGADAVTAEWFLNKTGTRMLAAAASAERVPVYVLASRDKFASSAVAARLTIREGEATELWSDAPPGIGVRNVYFERTPLDAVTGIISDSGVLDASMARQLCEALDRDTPAALAGM